MFDDELDSDHTSISVLTTEILIQTTTVTVLEAHLTLPTKRLWDIVILAYGCAANVLTNGIELSNLSYYMQA